MLLNNKKHIINFYLYTCEFTLDYKLKDRENINKSIHHIK